MPSMKFDTSPSGLGEGPEADVRIRCAGQVQRVGRLERPLVKG